MFGGRTKEQGYSGFSVEQGRPSCLDEIEGENKKTEEGSGSSGDETGGARAKTGGDDSRCSCHGSSGCDHDHSSWEEAHSGGDHDVDDGEEVGSDGHGCHGSDDDGDNDGDKAHGHDEVGNTAPPVEGHGDGDHTSA